MGSKVLEMVKPSGDNGGLVSPAPTTVPQHHPLLVLGHTCEKIVGRAEGVNRSSVGPALHRIAQKIVGGGPENFFLERDRISGDLPEMVRFIVLRP